MKIDTSKLSNLGDMVAIVAAIIFIALGFIVLYLFVYGHSFAAGFMCATIAWKCRDWVLDPVERLLDKLWT